MRYYKLIVALAVIASLTTVSFAGEATADSPKEFITDWVGAFNKNDPEQQLAFYDRSEEIEVLVSSGFRHRGYKAVQKAYGDDQKQLRYYDSTAKEISTRILGDTALVTFEHLFKIRFTEDDSRWQVHIRTTCVLNRMEGKWKIVLEHSSSIRGIERIAQIED